MSDTNVAVAIILAILLGVLMGAVAVNEMAVEPFNTCLDASIERVSLVWQKEYPYCHVPVTINGVEKLMGVEDYKEYTK